MATSGMGNHARHTDVQPNDPMLSEAARIALFDRKEAATVLAATLAVEAEALAPRLPSDLARQFEAFEWLPPFAKQFELATKAAFYASRGTSQDLEQLPSLIGDLTALADDLGNCFATQPDAPHHARILLDPEQIRRFTASLPASVTQSGH